MSSYLSRYVGADRLPKNLSSFDVEVYFQLPAETVSAIQERFQADRKEGADNRKLAMAAQVVFMRTTGRPLDNLSVLPATLLRHLGAMLKVASPSIASLRSIYQRRATATAHQQWAREHLGFESPSDKTYEQLRGVLLTHAGDAPSVDELVTAAQQWLFEQKIAIPGDRVLRDLAREAFIHVEKEAVRIIKKAIPTADRERCRKGVFESRPKQEITTLEWLKTPPRRHSPSTIEETLSKISVLKEFGADAWRIDAIPFARQRAYAQAVAGRPPSESKRRKDDTQLLEVICFLRLALLELTDSVLFQTGRRIADFARKASAKTEARQALRSGDYRQSLLDIKGLVHDESKSESDRLNLIDELIERMGDLSPNSHAAMVREVLTDDPSRIKVLLNSVSDLAFEGRPKEPALVQLGILRDLRAKGLSELPVGTEVPAGKLWKDVLDSEDRERAANALIACTALSLRKALRRGSVWVTHSLTFREKERMLIPKKEWERDRAKFLQTLGLPADAEEFLTPLLALTKAGLAALDEAHQAGDVTIDTQGELHLTALGPLPEETEPERLRNYLFSEIGDVQLPDLLLEVDAHTNFSEVLLGRRAKDEHELVALYAGMIAQGTESDAKTVAAMTPQLDPGHVSSGMRALESPTRVDKAIGRVVDFQGKHNIVKLWGAGELASSDMMSIDASRHLWNARIDPRRRTYAVGIYTHVLNNHGVIHHQPVVLNERQVGPAIEGVVSRNRQTETSRLRRLAVDTHGYTNVGMGLSKLLKFDLCPRLRDISERRLYLPKSIDTPDGLASVVVQDVSLGAIKKNWDELLRVAASILSGRVNATVMLQRMGSASQGDPVVRAADQLGRLLRTIFLCDYFSNRSFRREMHAVLNRGESVHQLQRTVYAGRIDPKRGRRRDELWAISGAHTLLTNIVIAWNTHRMQMVIDNMRKSGRDIEDKWIARIAPTPFGHINFRGLFRFGIERYRDALLAAAVKGSGRNLHAVR